MVVPLFAVECFCYCISAGKFFPSVKQRQSEEVFYQCYYKCVCIGKRLRRLSFGENGYEQGNEKKIKYNICERRDKTKGKKGEKGIYERNTQQCLLLEGGGDVMFGGGGETNMALN
jgi:hypothetical protein